MMMVAFSVKPSVVHGVGVFAEEFIQKGTLIWCFDDKVDRFFQDGYWEDFLSGLPVSQVEKLRMWSCCEPGGRLLSSDGSQFMNHSDDPNVCSGESSYALRDIQAGEELLFSYHISDQLWLHDR